MRKSLATIAAAAVALPAATVLLTASPAQAQCPGSDGTIPGTGARVIAAGPVYVDDRDYLDLDEDDDAGGIWLYLETNNTAGLQRGGDQLIFTVMTDAGVDPAVPTISPIETPAGVTLFPNGFGGGSLSETAGAHDDCKQSSTPDSILF